MIKIISTEDKNYFEAELNKYYSKYNFVDIIKLEVLKIDSHKSNLEEYLLYFAILKCYKQKTNLVGTGGHIFKEVPDEDKIIDVFNNFIERLDKSFCSKIFVRVIKEINYSSTTITPDVIGKIVGINKNGDLLINFRIGRSFSNKVPVDYKNIEFINSFCNIYCKNNKD
jgi:hypothetical protein